MLSVKSEPDRGQRVKAEVKRSRQKPEGQEAGSQLLVIRKFLSHVGPNKLSNMPDSTFQNLNSEMVLILQMLINARLSFISYETACNDIQNTFINDKHRLNYVKLKKIQNVQY